MHPIPDHITPDVSDFLRGFCRAWASRYSEAIPVDALAILYGQWCNECTGQDAGGTWRRGFACHHYNYGNIRAIGATGAWWAGDVVDLPGAWEVVDGQRVVTGGGFRAYRTPEDGAADLLALLASRYPVAVSTLRGTIERPDRANLYASCLHAGGYFTAPQGQYAMVVRDRAARFEREVGVDAIAAAIADAATIYAQPAAPPRSLDGATDAGGGGTVEPGQPVDPSEAP